MTSISMLLVANEQCLMSPDLRSSSGSLASNSLSSPLANLPARFCARLLLVALEDLRHGVQGDTTRLGVRRDFLEARRAALKRVLRRLEVVCILQLDPNDAAHVVRLAQQQRPPVTARERAGERARPRRVVERHVSALVAEVVDHHPAHAAAREILEQLLKNGARPALQLTAVQRGDRAERVEEAERVAHGRARLLERLDGVQI
mmetsp:Transcript_1812/g.5910  ORF Transcript_1812/g.5910 Transcript_1812/m.5910 type:complete len:204 (-) Transcript_1812:417-1028(-)